MKKGFYLFRVIFGLLIGVNAFAGQQLICPTGDSVLLDCYNFSECNTNGISFYVPYVSTRTSAIDNLFTGAQLSDGYFYCNYELGNQYIGYMSEYVVSQSQIGTDCKLPGNSENVGNGGYQTCSGNTPEACIAMCED